MSMTERGQYWHAHLQAIEAEGISTQAYARREGLSAHALYSWRKRLLGAERRSQNTSCRGQKNDFLPIRIEVADDRQNTSTLHIGRQLRIELECLPEPTWLAALSAALDEAGV